MEHCQNLALVKAWKDTLDKPFKAKISDLYYTNKHTQFYYFCQQCEDYFETAKAKSHKHVLFTIFFLKDRIFFYWQQYKYKIECDRTTLPSWEDFKAFFQKRLGESIAFVDNIWNKIKKDS